MKYDGDPKRLLALAQPGSLLERSLTTARDRGPTEADLRALGAAVFGASAGAAAAATKAGGSASRRAGLTKAVTVLAVAGMVAGAASVARSHRHLPTAPAPAAESSPATQVVPLAPEPEETSISQHAASRLERRRAPSPNARAQPGAPIVQAAPAAAPTAQKPTDSDEELRLVGAAQRALPRDPALALALAREHARRFPDGELAQERDEVAVSALWETGRRDEARARARRFVQEHPGSTYAGRMREILKPAELPAP